MIIQQGLRRHAGFGDRSAPAEQSEGVEAKVSNPHPVGGVSRHVHMAVPPSFFGSMTMFR